MSAEIYVFSGTGNSLSVAREIADNLPGSELCSIARMVRKHEIVPDGEVVGLVFPLYFLGIPEIVGRFIRKLKLDGDQYLFAVVTRGSSILDGAFYQINRKLDKQRRTIDAGFYIHMPGNYVVHYDRYARRRQNKLFAKAKLDIQRIARSVQDRQRITRRELLGRIASIVYHRWLATVNERDKNFFADERCNGCKVCVDICPVGNIVIIDGDVKWLGSCQQCMACLQLCPEHAIEYGNRTQERSRYHHPEVDYEDIIALNR